MNKIRKGLLLVVLLGIFTFLGCKIHKSVVELSNISYSYTSSPVVEVYSIEKR